MVSFGPDAASSSKDEAPAGHTVYGLPVMRGILNAAPIAVILATAVVLTLVAVLLAVWLVRRTVPATREGFHAEISAPMLGVVAALFGLLLAFVIIIAYENFLDARSNQSEEADALASIVRDSDAFPGGTRVRAAVGEYVREVVDDEWPLMHDGNPSVRAADAMTGLFAAFRTVEPRTESAKAFYADAVEQLNLALEARRDRLEAAEGGLPVEIAALIVFSCLVIVGYAVLVGSPHYGFHALGPAAIGVVVAFSLVVLVDLSYPFSGDLSITPEDFKTGSLAQFFPRG
jgi:hypothetical protein